MGQNTSEHIESRTTLVQNWLPHEKEPNILVNKVTNEQVQRHFIKILIQDLPRQIALFASRMGNHHPHICRLLYFHPSVPDPHVSQENKDFREMHLYTDKMLPLKIWNKQKLLTVLQALRKLVSMHGPIKVTEGMICQNEKGEVNIWISQNPVNNHPDSKYMSQEQTVANIGVILAKKNKDLAGQLFGCHTLKDVFEKINKNMKDNGTPISGYSHRASESGDFQKKKFEFIEKPPNLSFYRNVFGEKTDFSKNQKEKGQIFKQTMIRKAQDESKPTSNLSYYRFEDNFVSNVQKSAIEESPTKFEVNKKKSLYEPKIQFKNSKVDQEKVILPNNSKSMANLKHQSLNRSLSKHKQVTKNHSGAETPLNFKRFETNQQLGTNKTHFNSHTGLRSNAWQHSQPQNSFVNHKNEIPSQGGNSFYGSKNSNAQSTPNTNSQQQTKEKRNYDITIINNNYSHYVNNVVHNHVLKLQKKNTDYTTTQPSKMEETIDANNLHSSQKAEPTIKFSPPSFPNGKIKERSNFIPNFIQNKKKGVVGDNSPKSYHNKTVIQREDTTKSNSPLFSHFRQPRSDTNIEQKLADKPPLSFAPRNFERKTEKLHTFARPNIPQTNSNLSPYKNWKPTPKPNPHPKTPTLQPQITQNQSFSSYLGRPDLLGAFRTKTTDFTPKYKETKNKNDNSFMHNKSFAPRDKQTENSFLKSPKRQCKSAIKKIQDMTEPKPEIEKQLKEEMKRSGSPVQKVELKKQIRMQFGSLLGGDSAQKIEESAEPQKQLNKSEVKEVKKEGQVKDKIIKKKKAFAQLKKQAQQLLI